MKGFDKLVIENFQSHEHTEVRFTQGLNVFVGPSDSGKSAILRALRWVLYNEPKGTDFIRVGKKRCRVTLILSDGTEITRIRSAAVNRYILKEPGGEEQVYEGFGSVVPQEVRAAHGMHALKLDADWRLPAQFGTQLEPPFLLASTGSVRAKSIGRASGAHLIDIALQGTVKDLKGIGAKLKHVAEQTEDLKERLKPYEALPEHLEHLRQAEERYKDAAEMRERLEKIRRLKGSLDTCQREKREVRRQLQELSGVDKADRGLMEAEKVLFRHSLAERAFSTHRRIREEGSRWEKTLAQTRRIDEVERGLSELAEKQERFRHLSTLREQWGRVRRESSRQERIHSATGRIHQLDPDELERLGRRYQALLQLLPKVQSLGREQERLRNGLRKMARLPEDQVEGLNGLREKRDRLLSLEQEWTDCRDRLSRGRQFIAEKGEAIEKYTSELADLLRVLGRCPTCSSPVDESVLKHIMEEYGGGMVGAAAGREDQTT